MEQTGGHGERAGPLSGIRVLDLTSVVLGPLATQILGDYGADVVKVEGLEGDLMRANGVSRHAGMSSIFLAINRNKRSLSVDLKTNKGRRIFLDLAATVDVLVHNVRIPAIERLGLDYAEIKSVNPSIVYCAATGFGQDGPYRAKPAFDDIIQAASGMASLAATDGRGPEYVPTLVADKTVGMAVVNAVLAALLHRERTGHGQYIEVPMFESFVEFTMAEHMGGLTFRPQQGAAGYGRISRGGRRPVRTADGYIAMLPYSPAQWTALLKRIGREDLLSKYQLSDRHQLNASVRSLYTELAELAAEKPTAEWVALCDELDIPVTPVLTLDQMPGHPHLKDVRMFVSAEHPSEGQVNYVRPAVRFSETPASIRSGAPLLGSGSDDILLELGYRLEDIEDLEREKVIARAARRR